MTFLAGPAYACPFLEDKNRKPRVCDIVLRACGPNKIQIIKLLRKQYNVFISSLSETINKTTELRALSDAKLLAEKPFAVIFEDVYHYDALNIKKEFEDNGAQIDLIITECE